MRLDERVAEQFSMTRTKAKQLILEGGIVRNGCVCDKPSTDTRDEDCIEQVKKHAFVSRGGEKLHKAFLDFSYTVAGKVCLDIGASNGGFSDCMLQDGAIRVHAVDVGECALEPQVRNDPRVVIHDRTNARELTVEQLTEACDFCCIDVSFISLKLILPAAARSLKPYGEIIALIKPQFEAGRKELSKKGIVTSPAARQKVTQDIAAFATELGLEVLGLTTAPIHKEKNIEFLIYLRKTY